MLIDKIEINSESEVFYKIYQLKYIVKEFPDASNFKDNLKLLNIYIYYTQEYGVEINDKINDSYIITSESFERWYNWWKNYFDNEIPMNLWLLHQEVGTNVNGFRPQGSWQKEKELKKTL